MSTTGPASSTDDVVLEVSDLGVTFAGRVGLIGGLFGKKGSDARAVDGVSFDLRRGEVLALAGESGCGKTTTARAIMGLLTPQRGQILFEGKPVRNVRKFRRRVQMVFQDPMGSLNPRQTIYEIVAEALRIHGIHRGSGGESEEELVARALSRAGMRPPERFFLLYPHELSGGQRQRVVIAGALVLEPEIIVVTHDLGLAWTVADRVAVMYLGRIVEMGPAEDVLTKPLHPYTQALLNVVPEAEGIDRPILAGEPPDPTRIPPGCRFHPRCPELASGRSAQLGVEQKCRAEDLGLLELRPGHSAACHVANVIHEGTAVPAPPPTAAPAR